MFDSYDLITSRFCEFGRLLRGFDMLSDDFEDGYKDRSCYTAHKTTSSKSYQEKKLDHFRRSPPDKAAEEFNRCWGEFSIEADERFDRNLKELMDNPIIIYKKLQYGPLGVPRKLLGDVKP